jgi:iduronate 2-sulfatase
MKKLFLLLSVIVFSCVASTKNTSTSTTSTQINPTPTPTMAAKPNILFIALDDLKPYFNSAGYSAVKTPNIDRLIKSGIIFNSNYCQQAVCAPTRASLMTGMRPDKTQVWDLQTLIRDKNPSIVTLPQHLKANGYSTLAMGKIFDPRSVDKEHDAVSWSVPYKNKFKYPAGYEDIVIDAYQSPEMKAKFAKMKTGKGNADFDGPKTRDEIKVSTECVDVPDNAYFDGLMTDYAVKQLKAQKGSAQPFFMAVGFKKPHLPFVAPKKYWDLYDRNKIEVAKWQKAPIDGVEIAYHNSGELRSFQDIAEITNKQGGKKNAPLELPIEKQKELIHGYYACISYVDAQIGKLLDGLKAEGLDKNTVIVLWGDHGWHFGDHSLWCKHSNFEQATKAPLIFSVPNLTKGTIYTQPTEFVDVFPTLCELAGAPIPAYLDGKSLVPAMKDPKVKIKDFAISQYPRGGGGDGRSIMGYSLRNERFRYTEWVGAKFTTAKIFNEKDLVGVELYDLVNDPDETTNLANKAEMKSQVKTLAAQMRDYYKQQLATAGKVN